MNRTAFFRIVGKLNPYFRDAHCLVFPLREEADQRKMDGCGTFPFHVVLDASGNLRPERSYKREEDDFTVKGRWIIDSINGVSAAHLLDQIELYSHGETQQLRRHMTTLLFADWIFSIYGWCGDFDIKFKSGLHVIVKSTDLWISLEQNVVQYNRLEVLYDTIGYLRLNSFDVDEAEDAFKSFITDSFDSLRDRKIDQLIIDVRGNTGGQSDAGAKVLSYLTSRDISQVSKAYDRIHEGNAGWLSYRGKPGEVKELNVSSDELIKPMGPDERFNGRTVVLFDEMTYSAGILFITVVQDHKLATTLGRPTGGFANQTGNMETFTLPNSGLTVYAPSRKFIRVNGNTTQHVVVPDVIVSFSSEVEGDAVLDQAIQMLRNKEL